MQLVVDPMMEISGDREQRWGLWDDEKYDQKIKSMRGLLNDGHMFSKADWGGGDAGDPLFVYTDKVKNKKRKNKEEGYSDDEPVLKQKRLSAYFKRGIVVDMEKHALMESRLEEVCREVVRLNAVCEKHGRMLERLKSVMKGRTATKRRKSLRQKYRKDSVRGGEAIDEGGWPEDDVEQWNEFGTASKEDVPTLLVRLKAGEGASTEWVEGLKTSLGNKVLYQGVASGTYFVTEDELCDGFGG